ncbi:MAG: hypothetical protein J5898_03055 [Lachnospiraceae bacterium]|nr:hypothetical protein [Lachnospiraceae bacterium]
MQNRTFSEKTKIKATAGCVTIACFLLLFVIYPPMLSINDDMMIESILSGSYLRAYPYSYYFSAELGWILSSLYKVFPGAPWLGIFDILCNALCVYNILFTVLARIKTRKGKCFSAIFLILLFMALCGKSFVLLHYTVLSAVLGATGLFLFVTAKNKKEMIRPIMLLLLCYLVRENVCFMLLPWLGLVFLLRLSEEKAAFIKEFRYCAAVFALAFISLFLINRLSTGGEKWEEYLEYNDVRTEVYDYLGIYRDEAAESYFAQHGVNETELDLFGSYNLLLMDKERSGYEELKIVAEYAKTRLPGQKQRLISAFKSYVHRFLLERTDAPWNVVAGLFYAVLLLHFLWKKKLTDSFVIVLMGIYRSAFWTYLIYKGRYPERVTYSFYIMEIAVLAAVLYKEISVASTWTEKTGSKMKKVRILIAAAAGIFLLGTGILQLRETSKQYREAAVINADDNLLMDYMAAHAENFYFLDVYSIVQRTKPALLSQGTVKENYLWMGGWMTQQPLCLEKLDRLFDGAKNAKEALLTAEHAYLVLKEGRGMSVELAQKCLGKELIQEDSIQGKEYTFLIYRVE